MSSTLSWLPVRRLLCSLPQRSSLLPFADFFKLLTYLIFFGLILTFYGLPLNILRDVYLTFRSFILKIRDLRRYRQATKDMETLYPNATREEMEAMADKTCIICREDMEYRAPAGEAAAAGGAGAAPAPEGGEGGEGAEAAPAAPAGPRGPNDTPKKLPCGHVFHFHCLKSWLERQQSCPTWCVLLLPAFVLFAEHSPRSRRPVLPSEQPAAPPAAPGQRPPLPGNAAPPVDGAPPVANAAAADRNGADAVRQSQINLARALGREGFALLFPGVPFPPEAEAEAAAGGAGGGAAARLPQPPANGGPTLAVPPTPERVLQDPGAGAAVAAAGGAGGAEAGPSTSPPQPTPTAATPASIIPLPAAQAGNGALNPLAAFNLPQLPVPATGEAGLYHSPPSFSYPSTSTAPPPFPSATSPSPYANLAYGAYPHFSQFGPTGGMAPPPFPLPAGPTQLGQRHAQLAQRGQHGSGSGWRAGNVEEKMGRLRESWEREERRKEKGKGKEGEVAEDEEQEEEKHEKEEVSEEKEKKKDDKEERQGSEEKEEDSPVNRRRAAFRTAEARLGGSKISAKDKGKGKAVEGDVADSSSSPSIHERPQVSPRASSETVTSPLQTSASTATRPAPAPLGSNQHLPRLIPLFDPTSPSVPFPLSKTTFPPLLPTSSTSSSSLPPSTAAPTTDEAQQLDALVQQALERKLKLLVEFQGRVEGLVAELKGVVEGGSVATAVSPEPAVEDGEGEETAAVKEGAETVLGEAGVEDGEGEK